MPRRRVACRSPSLRWRAELTHVECSGRQPCIHRDQRDPEHHGQDGCWRRDVNTVESFDAFPQVSRRGLSTAQELSEEMSHGAT